MPIYNCKLKLHPRNELNSYLTVSTCNHQIKFLKKSIIYIYEKIRLCKKKCIHTRDYVKSFDLLVSTRGNPEGFFGCFVFFNNVTIMFLTG